MKIYTSNYKNIKFLERNNVLPVSISRFPPNDFTGTVFYKLAPEKELLLRQKANPDWKSYRIDFYGQLLGLDLAELCKDLRKISSDNDNRDIALCCYEDASANCHRHIVADFFNEFGLCGGNVHEFRGSDTLNVEEALF